MGQAPPLNRLHQPSKDAANRSNAHEMRTKPYGATPPPIHMTTKPYGGTPPPIPSPVLPVRQTPATGPTGTSGTNRQAIRRARYRPTTKPSKDTRSLNATLP
jgi:hypothetical protein